MLFNLFEIVLYALYTVLFYYFVLQMEVRVIHLCGMNREEKFARKAIQKSMKSVSYFMYIIEFSTELEFN